MTHPRFIIIAMMALTLSAIVPEFSDVQCNLDAFKSSEKSSGYRKVRVIHVKCFKKKESGKSKLRNERLMFFFVNILPFKSFSY